MLPVECLQSRSVGRIPPCVAAHLDPLHPVDVKRRTPNDAGSEITLVRGRFVRGRGSAENKPLSRTIKVNASDKDADTTHTQRFPRLYHRCCNGVPMMNYANRQRDRTDIEQSNVPVPSRRNIDDVEHNWGRVLEPLCKGPLFGSNPRTMTQAHQGSALYHGTRQLFGIRPNGEGRRGFTAAKSGPVVRDVSIARTR